MPASAPVHYRVAVANPHEHHFAVELTIRRPAARQVVSLPVWIPGSYLVREFARHLNGLAACQGNTACSVEQLDKCSWAIAADPRRPLTLRYRIHALDASVRTAWLDAERGFFNGTSLLLRVHGQEAGAHALSVRRPRAAAAGWQLATAMTPVRVDAHGFGDYRAADYDELVDHPVEMGAFWSGEFEAGGVPHRFIVAGAPASFDGARLLHDAERICSTAIRFWHGDGAPPFDHYVFLLNAVGDGYGGLEHRASTALICKRGDLPRLDAPAAAPPPEGYVSLLGLISHEYFHAWNVKRLKPAEFAPYDYARENYTRLLWFFEGLTSYYDDLLLRRAGLIDDAAYLKLLTRTTNQVLQAPGRHMQSVAQASFDAWVRFYRPDANTPNSTISYYAKGALVALCLDLTLRSEGRATLDDVMRALWQRCAGGPLTEADIAAVLAELGGRSFARELADWVHGTGELPLEPLLAAHGIEVARDPSPLAQALGLRVEEDRGIRLKVVLDGSPAAAAGLAAGDEWLGLEVPATAPTGVRARAGVETAWRLTRLDDIPLYAGPARTVIALVARDQRLLRLPLTLPEPGTTWRLAPRKEAASASPWPGG
ncbi:MAG TPA: peptidase M61 [Ottowia sp.]|uniref:M61 family metallopeptidase n=1 Tax=Ottowia sp. TaxID=1898956 RepID=UPI002BD5A8F7|nr:peptidase M61 [Ottowia sp.]HMN22506.1 peptidase M61 [Ottowia sp.]